MCIEAYKVVNKTGSVILHENITSKESKLTDSYRAVQPKVKTIKTDIKGILLL
jgi:hypothetical protein